MQEKNFFSYSGLKICDNKLWYVTEEENFLMNIDIQSGIVESVGIIPGTEGIYLAYRGLVVSNNILYLIPFNTCRISTYDVLNQVYNDIIIPSEIIEIVGEKPQFFEGEIIDDKLIIYGFTHFILIYDISNGFMETLDIMDEVGKLADIDKWYLRFGVVFERKVYINLHYTNIIVAFDTNEKTIEVNLVGKSFYRNKYSMLLKQGDIIYYVFESVKGTIGIRIINSKDLKMLDEMEWDDIESCGEVLPRFLWGTILGNELLMFPGHLSTFARINLESKEMKTVHIEDPKTNWNWDNCWTSFYGDVVDDYAISIMPGKRSLIIAKRDSIEFRKVTINKNAKKIISKCYMESYTSGNIIFENTDAFSLGDFIGCIT